MLDIFAKLLIYVISVFKEVSIRGQVRRCITRVLENLRVGLEAVTLTSKNASYTLSKSNNPPERMVNVLTSLENAFQSELKKKEWQFSFPEVKSEMF